MACILIIHYTGRMDIFAKYALKTPDMLLPTKSVDRTAWSVIACDQDTQDTDYWATLQRLQWERHAKSDFILNIQRLHKPQADIKRGAAQSQYLSGVQDIR